MSEFIGAIEAVLNSHPLSQKIVQFLVENEDAMDTINGVANCWVNSDEVAVKSVLDRLQSAGVVSLEVLNSGTYYRLTTNAEIRSWLKTQSRHFQKPQQPLAATAEG